MEHRFEVKIDGTIMVAGKAESESDAERAAHALKTAFPEAFVQYQRPVLNDQYKPYRWVIVSSQSPADFT